MISAEAMRAVCQEVYATMVEKHFGTKGVDALFAILGTVRELYRHVEPVRVKGTIIVFCRVASDTAAVPAQGGQLCSELDWITPRAGKGFILEITPDGRRFFHAAGSLKAAELALTAVVYEYESEQEFFLAAEDRKQVIRFVPAAASQFSVPTFFTLREALQRYADTCVRYSGCPVFSNVWADSKRLFFKPGPEEEMRRSLTLFLKSRLGAGYEVRPEQIMDESHPVDIKVTYTPANRLMIIEIKWLGDSRSANGDIGTTHRDARAKDGASQLAGYLDQNKVQAPLHVTHGYYVIIDGRRRGLKAETDAISREDGLHYASLEIVFSPEFHVLREDFDPPYRMFVEPVFQQP